MQYYGITFFPLGQLGCENFLEGEGKMSCPIKRTADGGFCYDAEAGKVADREYQEYIAVNKKEHMSNTCLTHVRFDNNQTLVRTNTCLTHVKQNDYKQLNLTDYITLVEYMKEIGFKAPKAVIKTYTASVCFEAMKRTQFKRPNYPFTYFFKILKNS